MNLHTSPPRDQLVSIMHRIYRQRMTTLSGGNLSIVDENGDLWITPAGIDKATLTPADIMRVQANGTVEGPHRPSSEYPFHQAIYQQRPDLRAIVHAHPPALVSFSIARQLPNPRVMPDVYQLCGPVGYAPYALTGSDALGQVIAETFAQSYDVVLLENHGIVTGGEDLLTAFGRLETLDFCARTLLNAGALAETNTPTEVSALTEAQLSLAGSDSPIADVTKPDLDGQAYDLARQLVEITHRAYDGQMMTCTQGTISARLDAQHFLITPPKVDRRALAVEDMLLIPEGDVNLSGPAALHNAIYSQAPHVNCIITAQPPHIMAYAITPAKFSSKTIPESYIFLRDVPVIPFEVQARGVRHIGAVVSKRSPVLLLQNNCVLTTGQTILQAFDRLEIAEFSAKALIDTLRIGELIPMGEAEIRDLEKAFPVDA